MNKIGEGILTWDGHERRSDRYGFVYLMPEGPDSNSLTPVPVPSVIDAVAVNKFYGERGELIAVVTKNRESTHIGDLFRGVGPTTPEVGEIIKLGSGKLTMDSVQAGGIMVGLEPEDGRTHDWLDIKSLYRAHEQSVKLFFHPQESAK